MTNGRIAVRSRAWGFLAAGALVVCAPEIVAQDAPTGPSAPGLRGLLRPGFEVQPESSGRGDGFIVYDARLAVYGTAGFLFDYELGIEVDRDDSEVDLLDAFVSIPFADEMVRLALGGLRSPFGVEANADKQDLSLVERSQGTLALAPGRQVGVRAGLTALDTRFHAAAGLFNGEGLRFDNPDGGFLLAGRASYNNVGDLEFPEDFVWELGASLGWSSDSATSVLPVSGPAGGMSGAPTVLTFSEFAGDRLLWGVDARLAYEGWSLAAEYLRADYDPDSGPGLHADGLRIDLRHALWGIFDVGGRYDSFTPAIDLDAASPIGSRYLVLGAGVTPGLSARVSLQYAIGLDEAPRGVGQALDGTNTAPPLADGQLLLYLQLAF